MSVSYFKERKHLKEGFKNALVSLHLYRLDKTPGDPSAETKRRKANLHHFNSIYESLNQTHKVKPFNKYFSARHMEHIFRCVIRTSGFGNPWEYKYAHLLAEELKKGYMTHFDFAAIIGDLNKEGS